MIGLRFALLASAMALSGLAMAQTPEAHAILHGAPIPAPAAADQCQHYVGQPVHAVHFTDVAARFATLTPRSEYETTAHFEARRAAVLGTLNTGPIIILKDSGTFRNYVHYDADAQALRIDPEVIFDADADVPNAVSATGSSEPSGYGHLGVEVVHNEQALGSYRSSNAFGVRATVTRWRNASAIVWDGAERDIMHPATYAPITLNLSPAEAQRIRPLLRFAVAVRLREPYFGSGSWEGRTPTIDDPNEDHNIGYVLFAHIDCGLVIGPSGIALAAYSIPHGPDQYETDAARGIIRRFVPVDQAPLRRPEPGEQPPESLQSVRYRWDPTPPAQASTEPAHERASLTSYISDADYPVAALRAREQGRVDFTLTIDTAGRVNACTITHSSGSAALDDATCRIMRSRARFTPSRDEHGNPVEDSVSSALTWTLPRD